VGKEERGRREKSGEARLNGVKSEDRKIFVAIIRLFFDAHIRTSSSFIDTLWLWQRSGKYGGGLYYERLLRGPD
jgi:hypothetical protein